MRKAMSKKVGAGGRFNIFLDSGVGAYSRWGANLRTYGKDAQQI